MTVPIFWHVAKESAIIIVWLRSPTPASVTSELFAICIDVASGPVTTKTTSLCAVASRSAAPARTPGASRSVASSSSADDGRRDVPWPKSRPSSSRCSTPVGRRRSIAANVVCQHRARRAA